MFVNALRVCKCFTSLQMSEGPVREFQTEQIYTKEGEEVSDMHTL